MLPKTKRLTAKDFKGLKPRLLYRGAQFDVAGTPSDITKYACVISKKRVKRAVDRIKARRRVYTALHSISPRTPHSIIIYPTKGILSMSTTELSKEFAKAFATL